MTNISVRLTPVGTTIVLSKKSYRLFKLGYIGSIMMCALAIPIIILENNARLSASNIAPLLQVFHFVFFIPTVILITHAAKAEADSTAKVSYLPVIHIGLLVTLLLLWFHTVYLRYGGA